MRARMRWRWDQGSFDSQKRLIADCESMGRELSAALRDREMDYDSLVYADGATVRTLSRLPDFIPVDRRLALSKGVPCVSFFSGAGGIDIGFECAGFKTVANARESRHFPTATSLRDRLRGSSPNAGTLSLQFSHTKWPVRSIGRFMRSGRTGGAIGRQ